MTEVFSASLPALTRPEFILDWACVEANLARLRTLADGVPLRIASKSLRVRGVLEWALSQPGTAGVLGYCAGEAVWLAQQGLSDILIAYPSVDADAMRTVAQDAGLREAITFMVDSIEHVTWVDAALQGTGGYVNVAVDFDCALHLGPITLGAHRSPVRTVEQVRQIGEAIAATDSLRVAGMMFYEAQVAGVQDATPIHRVVKKRSMDYLLTARASAVAELKKFGDVRFVNGGGSGSVHITRQDPTVTDIAVGSGLFTPTTFDGFDVLGTQAAAFFASPVVRRYADDVVVTFSGGYNASGASDASRAPRPVYPQGLKFFGQEGAGEVQTPLRGEAARGLKLGDPVWFRHAKSGEVAERFDRALVIENGAVTRELPTYRGEGQNFS